jgi:2-polyprenyl-3-methyl-5-hydroxy-6-metoxy-1,4-benzoquinol methylase
MESAIAAQRRDALVERLFEAILGVMDVHALYVGDRLGLYRALAGEPLTPRALAAATSTHERYVREWLEQQAVSGILEVDDVAAAPGERRYRLPAGHAEGLVDDDSLSCMAPFARMMVGMLRPLPAVLEAFRSGGGVPYADYDADFCEGQGRMNRAMFVNLLGTEWLPQVADVHARLLADPPARVADVACGTGWSAIALARAYSLARVDGFDLDPYSIELARANAAAAGLQDRLRFEVRDAAEIDGAYDLVTVFEAIHDMSRPVEALAALRRLVEGGGTLIVADERVAETFTAPGDDVERLMYGFSILHCLPVGMAEQPSAATGTALRPATLRRYAADAGFHDVAVLAIENDFWRFYRLHP